MTRLNSKAVALMIVLAIILLLIVLIAIGIKFTLSNTFLSYYTLNRTKAFYFAEAGIQKGVYKIKNDNFDSETGWILAGEGENIAITISSVAADEYSVLSVCTYEAADKKIQATVRKAGSTAQIIEWVYIN
ncbi:MAG: hypothetical protein WC321_01665 [Candidatus Omnitrophota bacterium]|jgi:Tfp pilus assembly protein PilX